MTNTQFFKLSLIPVLFFIVFYSLYSLKIEYTIIGTIRELFTLPMIGFMVMLTIWSYVRLFLKKKTRKPISFFTLVLLSITSTLVIESFL